MADHSETPLVQKLGIKKGMQIVLVNAPEKFEDLLDFSTLEVTFDRSVRPNSQYIHFFTTSKAELEKSFPDLKKHLSSTGILWISWPKAGSEVNTDLNENFIREVGLKNGLVDVKVCAIDKTWSALKFIFRLKDR